MAELQVARLILLQAAVFVDPLDVLPRLGWAHGGRPSRFATQRNLLVFAQWVLLIQRGLEVELHLLIWLRGSLADEVAVPLEH